MKKSKPPQPKKRSPEKKATRVSRLPGTKEAVYKTIVENIPDAFFLTKPDGTIVEANGAACKMFGYKVEEFKRIGRKRIIDQGNKAVVAKIRERKKGYAKGELSGIKKNGERFPIEFSTVLIHDTNGDELNGTIMIDVSVRKRIEREVSLLLHNTEESFILLDKALKIVSFNKQFETLYKRHYGIKVKRGDSILKYAPAEKLDTVRQIYENVLQGRPEASEIIVPMKNGFQKAFVLRYSPAKDENNNTIGVFVTAVDNTETKKSQALLESSEKRFRALVENGADAVVILTAEGKSSYVSPSICRLLGYTEEEALGKYLFDLIHPEDQEGVGKVMQEVFANPGIPVRGHTARTRHKDGSWRWLEASVTNMLHDPNINGIIDNIWDVTDKILAEEKLKKTLNELNERVKEQTCLYNISNLSATRHNVAELLTEAVQFLPPGFQYSPVAAALIEYHGKVFKTHNFQDTQWKLTARKLTEDLEPLVIQVCYLEPKPEADEGPFLKEERSLINSVAANLALNISQITIREQLLENQRRMKSILDSETECVMIVAKDRTLVDMNPAGLKMIEADDNPGSAIGEEALRFIHPEDISAFLNLHDNALKGIKGEARFRIIGLKQTQRWLESSCVPLRNNEGLITSVLSVMRDTTDKIEAEERLLKSEEKYRMLFNASPLPTWIYELDTYRILDVNHTAIKLYGYSEEEFLKMTLMDFHPDQEIPKLLKAHEGIRERTGQINFGVFIHRNKKGGIMKMNVTGHPMRYQDRDCMMAIYHDVTEKERVLEELIDKETKLLNAQKIARLGYWHMDIQNKTLYWSDEVYHIWGVSKEEVKPDFNFFLATIHPGDKQSFLLERQAALAGEREYNFEHRIMLSDGTIRWVHEMGKLEKDDNGLEITFSGTVQDITARKGAEENLANERNLLRTLIDNLPDYIYVKDTASRHLINNQANVALMGAKTEEETIGKSVRDFFDPQLAEKYIADDRNVLVSKMPVLNREEPMITPSGEQRWLMTSKIPLLNTKGESMALIGISRDITDRKNEELQKSLLSEISQLFHESRDLNEILEEILKRILTLDSFCLAEAWLIDTNKKHINLSAWRTSDQKYNMFYNHPESLKSLTKGEGLPGLVWERQALMFWPDAADEKLFARKEAARKAHLGSVYGLPLSSDNEVIGVLLLALDKQEHSKSMIISMFENFGRYIGAEIRRRQLENELNEIFNTVPDVICIAGFDGYFKKVNPAMCRMLEYSAEEIQAVPYLELIHPEDRHLTLMEAKKISEGKPTFIFENRYLTKSGKIKWLSWTANPVVDEGLMYASAKDITEKRELEDLLKKAAGMARIGSWEIDLFKNELYWSDMTKQIHEVEVDYIPTLEHSTNFYKSGKNQETIRRLRKEAIEKGTPWDAELQIVTAKGNERWVRAIGEAEFLDNKCIRLYGSFQDIHEWKLAELEREKLLRERNTILESIGDAFFAVDKAFVVTYWNRLAESLLLTPRESIIGKNLWDVFSDAKDLPSYTNYHKAMEENITIQFEDFYLPVDKWFEVSVYPASNGLSVYFKDITARKKAELQLLAKSKQLNAIAEVNSALLKHDHWLQAVNGSLEIIAEAVHADRVYFYEIHYDEKTDEGLVSIQLEYCRTGITPQLNKPDQKDIPFSSVPDFINPLLRGQPYMARVKEMPKGLTKEMLQSQNVLSVLVLPIMVKRKLRGFIGFDDSTTDRQWSEEEVSLLRTIATNLSTAIEKHAAEEGWKLAFEEKNEILESIADNFYALDKDYRFTYLNQSTQNLLQIRMEDALGKSVFDMFPLLKETIFYDRIKEAGESGIPSKFEMYSEPLAIWFDESIYPRPDGFSVFFRDISDKKEAEKALQKAYEERNTILESIGDAFFAADNNWKITYWNKAAEEVLKLKKEDILGKNLWEVYRDVVDTDINVHYSKAIETRKAVHFEEYYETLRKWVEVSAYPSAEGISVYFKDVTQRKEATEKIRQSNERFERVTEATNDAIWDWDIETNILYWGSGFKKLFGYDTDKENPTLKSWTDHIHTDDVERVMKSIDDLLRNKEETSFQSEYRYRRADGEYATVVNRGVVIRDMTGKPVRMVGAMQDITQRKEYEESLKKLNADLEKYAKDLTASNEELERFAYVASHDLQEPLRMITSFLTQLEKKYGESLDERGKKYIGFAVDGAKRMRQIILELLEFSRVGKVSEASIPIPLNELLAEIMILYRKQIEDTQAVVNVEKLPVIVAPRTLLRQIFQNLIGNALKYTKQGECPEIKISVKETDTHWQFTIADNGIGINAAYFDRIFVVFQRLHNQKEYPGVGMGLAICKKIVEHLNGKIWLESEEGKGSTFYFTISK